MKSILRAAVLIALLFAFVDAAQAQSIWLSPSEIAALPTSGVAWNNVLAAANNTCGTPDLTNQDDPTNVCILAKALVFARTGQTTYRTSVVTALTSIVNMGTYNGRALALGRELGAYVISADLINLKTFNPTLDAAFRLKIKVLLTTFTSSGPSDLIDCHETRPNNWGTHCGATRAAVDAYLGDLTDLARVAKVFKGWLGDRSSYAGFSYGSDLTWQCNPSAPVGINPPGCTKNGHSIDGVLPDDQRRAGSFTWPPPQENYVYEALQGAIVQAVILQRAGYPTFSWQNQALLRAYTWLHVQCLYDAQGDDTWQPHLVNHFYGSNFPAPTPTTPGKNMGWTDWTHSGTVVASPVLSVTPTSLSFSATAGGANPASSSFSVSNTGGGTLSWTAASSQSWINVSPASGSGAATVTVSIDTAGMAAGTYAGSITVSASGSGAATVSVSIDIAGMAAGTYTGSITVSASNASGSPDTVGVTLTLAAPAVAVNSESVSPNPVVGGSSATGTVTLNAPAPSGGKVVSLSDNSAYVTVPTSVTVPAGATSALFNATTSAVTSRQQCTITASLNGSVSVILLVDPSTTTDTTPPTISAVVAGLITSSGATITWTTNEPATTQVIYGTTTNYGSSSTLNTTLVTSHSVTLSGLTANTLYHFRVNSKDAAGNLATSADFTFTTASTTTTSCKTSSTTWKNTAFTAQYGNFTAEFDATPAALNMDGVMGLSAGSATGYTSLAAIARFNKSGNIDARNGGAYAAASAIPYAAGLKYHFRLVVRVASHTYDIYVTPPGSTEKVVGLNYKFRTEQATVAKLNNMGIYSAVSSATVCGLAIY